MLTASNAILIGSTEIILTVLFAALFLGEKLTLTKFLLAIISFLGVFFLLGTNTQGAIKSSLVGDLLVLLSTVFAVIYVLVSKAQIATTTSPLELTASQQLVGLIVTVLCFGSLSLFLPSYEVDATDISPQFWLRRDRVWHHAVRQAIPAVLNRITDYACKSGGVLSCLDSRFWGCKCHSTNW